MKYKRLYLDAFIYTFSEKYFYTQLLIKKIAGERKNSNKSISIASKLQYLYFIFLIHAPERWEMLESNIHFAIYLQWHSRTKKNKPNNSNEFRSVIEQFVCFFPLLISQILLSAAFNRTFKRFNDFYSKSSNTKHFDE